MNALQTDETPGDRVAYTKPTDLNCPHPQSPFIVITEPLS